MEKQNLEIIYHGSLHKLIKLIRNRNNLSIRKKRQQKMGLDDTNTKVKRLKALKRVIHCEMRKAYWS